MSIKKTAFVTVALAALAAGWPSRAAADQSDKRTYLTFSQPVSIPGKVLPAGTYTFQLFNSASDRHIVQIFNRKGTQLFATIRVIPQHRLTATGDTVVGFGEQPGGMLKAITYWFYPGDTEGQEFVYQRRRRDRRAARPRTQSSQAVVEEECWNLKPHASRTNGWRPGTAAISNGSSRTTPTTLN